jgi:phosphocarrier protein HPr
MSDQKAIRTVVVTNPSGIHARSAVDIAKVARNSRSKVMVSKDYQHAAGTDVLAILSLASAFGSQVTIEATGPDAQQVLDALEPLFGPYEDERDQNQNN